jgi:hypothetical protein
MMAITTSNSMRVKARSPRESFMVSVRSLSYSFTDVTSRRIGFQQMGELP